MTTGTGSRAARVLRMAGWAERQATFAAFMILVAVLFADVLSRELSGAGLLWARQLGVYANLVVTMLGLGVASASGAHFRPRFADDWLPATWEPWLVRLQEALMAAFCVGFALVAAVAVAETRALHERSSLPSWPVWPFQAVIPLAFLSAGTRHALLACWPQLRPAVRRPAVAVVARGES